MMQDTATLKTPFFLFDEVVFRDNITRFRAALEAYSPQVIIGYSVKTNYTPGICLIARDMGCHAEVVSRMELDLARALDFPKGALIFNGPLKHAEDIALAIEMGGMINFDSLDQVQTLLDLPADVRQAARIGLRINVDLSAGLKVQDKIAEGGVVPRFGLPACDVAVAVTRLHEAGLEVQGLHGHASSSDRQPENYSKIAQLLLDLCKAHNLSQIQVLDVGGGFFGHLPDIWGVENAPSFEDYAAAIFAPMKVDPWFQIHNPIVAIEPGMAILADAMTYVTEVMAVKKVMNQTLASVDGTYYDVRPTLHQKPLPAQLLTQAPDGADEAEGGPSTCMVVGATCMERDILLHEFTAARPLTPGDRIEIGNLGAYTSVLSPHFITYAAGMYAKRPDGTVQELRRHQTFGDLFAPYAL